MLNNKIYLDNDGEGVQVCNLKDLQQSRKKKDLKPGHIGVIFGTVTVKRCK